MGEGSSPLGRALTRREDERLVRGLGRFCDDVPVAGCLHAAFVRSPHARARIRGIGTAAARAMAGVRAVLTGADLARLCTTLRLAPPIEGLRPVEMPPMPVAEARFVGDPVAMVVAASALEAELAAERVEVEWEALTPITSVEEAGREGAELVDATVPRNLVSHQRIEPAGLAAAFAGAPRIVTARFVQQRQTHVPMEPRGCIAIWDAGRDHLTMMVGTQAPHPYRAALAARLHLSEAQVTVRSPDMGGGFGQKIVLMREELAVAAAARLLGGARGAPREAAVRWREGRGDNLAASLHAREESITMRAAVSEEGTILALDATIDIDFGAWCFFPANYMARMTAANLPGAYRIDHFGREVRVWLTNKCPSGPMRAPMAIAAWVTEGTIEAIAREIGRDPLEVRRRNMLGPEHLPYVSGAGERIEAVTPLATLDAAAEMIGYAEARAAQRAAWGEGRLLGIGICAVLEANTYGSAFYRASGIAGSGHEAAVVRVEPTGAVLASCGLMGSGQGYETTLAQAAAAGLGADVGDVTMQLGDTDVAPYGMGSRGARGATAGGSALWLAGRKLREKALAIAAGMLGLNSAEGITLRDGVVLQRMGERWEETGVKLAEIARRAHFDPLNLPAGMEPGLHAVAAYDPPPLTFTNSAHACLVEIDRESGEVRILRYVAAEDVGQAINPIVVEGQTHGAIGMGISNVLMEHAAYGADGQFLAGSFMDYALARAEDLPDFEVAHMDHPTPATPAGIKGMAEGGVLGAVGAVMNAVNDALALVGARLEAEPASAERVWRALTEASGREASGREARAATFQRYQRGGGCA